MVHWSSREDSNRVTSAETLHTGPSWQVGRICGCDVLHRPGLAWDPRLAGACGRTPRSRGRYYCIFPKIALKFALVSRSKGLSKPYGVFLIPS